MSSGYYSSKEKDTIREQYSLPLLHALKQRKGQRLNYVGLPGGELRDIQTWREVISEVVAVEGCFKELEELRRNFLAYLPKVRHEIHWGDMDDVILNNRGRDQGDGASDTPWVGNCFEDPYSPPVWDFDVVYLDYFGPFLPYEGDEPVSRAQNRVRALRKLFETDRLDARRGWVLLVTVDTEMESCHRERLRRSLKEDRLRCSHDASKAVEFLLSEAPTEHEESARLIHAALAFLVATAAKGAGLEVQPRGTLLYSGSGDHKMVHLSYEFSPSSGHSLVMAPDPLPLLTSPIVSPKALQLLSMDCPGSTESWVRDCLSFLTPSQVETVIAVK